MYFMQTVFAIYGKCTNSSYIFYMYQYTILYYVGAINVCFHTRIQEMEILSPECTRR